MRRPYEGKTHAQEAPHGRASYRSDYQPSKAELEEDMNIDASLEELVQAVAEPVTIKYIPRPKQK